MHAAEAAERVFGYAEAARHWQRAIDLYGQVSEPELLAGMDLPELYVRCLNALQAAGEYEHFGALATEAYGRYAEHSNPMIAALVQLRLAESRWHGSLADFREPLEQALRLFEELPPSADHARA